MALPAPAPQYDAKNEAELRRLLEQELAQLRATMQTLLAQQVVWSLNEATNSLSVSVRYSTGARKNGSITLA